ncbi:hypothetical protein ACTJIL_11795 [Luteimonas sp. 22616]|uniref:hypothetical protein n=1 Tax=Luteimonas sp. 22616 TaxID=3453951 RepID=UPI003F84E63C
MKMLLGLILTLTACSVVASDVHTVPLDIRRDFKESSCAEVLDYYSDSNVIEKPYLYGVVSIATGTKIENDYSFIAWCKSIDKNVERPYVLVGKLNGVTWPGGCKFPVRGFDYPGGVSITRRKVDLGLFADFQNRSVGKNTAFGPVVQSERDGLAYEVFCHRGRWLKRSLD